MRKSLRGGNSIAYIKNGVLYSDNDSGCLRRILLRSEGVDVPVTDQKTQNVFSLGHLSEEYFGEVSTTATSEDYIREKPVSEQLTQNVYFEGHSDFASNTVVWELKSVTSKNTYRKVFKKGEAKHANVIQLVNYMLALEVPLGFLQYTSFCDVMDYSTMGELSAEQVKELAGQSTKEKKTFKVEITESGEILVDNKVQEYTVRDIVTFRMKAAEVLEGSTIYLDRPSNIESGGMTTACSYCKFAKVCDRFEELRYSSEEFIKEAKEILL